MTHKECLARLEAYIDSGDLAYDFEHGEEERRHELLDLLELTMDVAEKADALATRLIFKNTALGQMTGVHNVDDATD